MRAGISLLTWTTDPTDPRHLPLFERLAALGFDGVELPIYRLDPKAYGRLGRRLDDLGLARTAGTALTAPADPRSAEPSERAAAGVRLGAVIECCQAVGAPLLAGPMYTALGTFTGLPPTADERLRAAEVIAGICPTAHRAGVTLALEFLNRFETHMLTCVADAVSFADAVGHPRCRLMYDTFHAHIEERDPAAAIAAIAPHLAYVHTSESHRGTPGTGQIRWDETFAALRGVGYDGWLTIEAFGQALPELAAATRIWRAVFADSEALAREGLAFLRGAWDQARSNGPVVS
jgi:D-psicose/D-tagatose/L-ribulose 3-epimerase